MAAQHHVVQPLPFDDVYDVGDVGADVDARPQQMRAFA